MADDASAQPGLLNESAGARAINEKPLAGEPASSLSFALHAVFGMEHYPGYLLKWQDAQLGELERVFEEHLSQVRRARAAVQARAATMAAYTPLHRELAAKPSVEALLNADLLRALLLPSPLAALSRLLTEEAPGVYSLPLLATGAACELLLSEVDNWAGWHATQAAPWADAGFNRRHAPLGDMGLDALQDTLLSRVLAPLGRLLYPAVAARLDYRYGYVIGYSDPAAVAAAAETAATTPAGAAGGEGALLARSGLRHHTDDAEVTLNLCLGREFSGGDLVFRGLRNSASEGSEEAIVRPRPGRAVLHLGQHLHEVTTVTGGQRYALIVWARSSAYRAAACPCCVLNRRAGCVCDGSWN